MLKLRCADFADGGEIPLRHTRGRVAGALDESIGYEWEGAPPQTRSFALALVDLAPVANRWVHWLVVDIPAEATGIPAGASQTAEMPTGSREIENTYGIAGYGGPNPPRGTGDHPYVATLYALDVERLGLLGLASLDRFLGAIEGHVLESAECTGYFGNE
ncbi:MAG: YbhB/YbcL family Raf kinase inhibitor-like protein [Coriobacteriia bacterium]